MPLRELILSNSKTRRRWTYRRTFPTQTDQIRIGKMPNMFCFCFLINVLLRENNLLKNLDVQLNSQVLLDQKYYKFVKIDIIFIQSAFFLAYTWNPPSIRVLTTEPFHAWSTVPLIAYDESIISINKIKS